MGSDTDTNDTEQPTLYLIVAECPRCSCVNRLVEEKQEPVNLMQDVGVTAHTCDFCGHAVGTEGGEWDVQEEVEIERVRPTQERSAVAGDESAAHSTTDTEQ
jgi:hypothetical protein